VRSPAILARVAEALFLHLSETAELPALTNVVGVSDYVLARSSQGEGIT
jgi:hypothetical protein